MHGIKQTSEQCLGRHASSVRAFIARRRSLWKRSDTTAEESKVLRTIVKKKKLQSFDGNMSTVGRSGRGQRAEGRGGVSVNNLRRVAGELG